MFPMLIVAAVWLLISGLMAAGKDDWEKISVILEKAGRFLEPFLEELIRRIIEKLIDILVDAVFG